MDFIKDSQGHLCGVENREGLLYLWASIVPPAPATFLETESPYVGLIFTKDELPSLRVFAQHLLQLTEEVK